MVLRLRPHLVNTTSFPWAEVVGLTGFHCSWYEHYRVIAFMYSRLPVTFKHAMSCLLFRAVNGSRQPEKIEPGKVQILSLEDRTHL